MGEIPEKVDLAIIATPAKTVPSIVEECGKAGIIGLIIVSAGFKEIGPKGKELEWHDHGDSDDILHILGGRAKMEMEGIGNLEMKKGRMMRMRMMTRMMIRLYMKKF